MKNNLVKRLLVLTITSTLLAGCANNTTETTNPVRKEAAPSTTEPAASTQSDRSSTEKQNQSSPSDEAPEEAPCYDTEAVAESADSASASAKSTYESSVADSYYEDIYYDEEYSSIVESGYMNTTISPLSTFAADVDTASYSNFRRFVNDYYTLDNFPADAIRTEEMINYFTYDYAAPSKKDIFNVSAQISDCPWNEDANLMVLGVNTKEMNENRRPKSNIVFLIDVSGSMSDYNKLPLIRESMNLLMDKFDADDRISIVTYASGTSVEINGVPGNKTKKILRAFDRLDASGSTNGGDGIKLAYEVAEKNFIKGGVNRVIICSDGDFNVGLTSQSELEDLITDKKDSGIFLSVLGFGMGNYKDTTMETLADCGNGNYAYIDTLAEAKKVLVDEMMKNFVAVAKDVKLQVEFNPSLVSEYRLVGYENRAMAAEDFTDDTKDGGEMGAGHQITAVYEIIMSNGNIADSDLKYQSNTATQKGASKDEFCTLSIAYKDINSDSSKYLEFPIGADNYTLDPDDNFIFASCVTECSLALRNSEYLADVTPEEAIEDIIDTLEDMDYTDEYRDEFYDLLVTLSDNSSYYEDEYYEDYDYYDEYYDDIVE